MTIDPARLALYVSLLSLALSLIALGANIGKAVKGLARLAGWCSDCVWLARVRRALPSDAPGSPPHPADCSPWWRGEGNDEVRWFIVNHPRRHRAVERGRGRGLFTVDKLEDGRMALGPLPRGTPPMSIRGAVRTAWDEVEERRRKGQR